MERRDDGEEDAIKIGTGESDSSRARGGGQRRKLDDEKVGIRFLEAIQVKDDKSILKKISS